MHEMVVKSGLFEGAEGHAIPAHNTIALLAGDFRICGMMIATAICHGGRAPHCFSQSFAEYVVYGKLLSPVNCREIPDADIREKMQKVQ